MDATDASAQSRDCSKPELAKQSELNFDFSNLTLTEPSDAAAPAEAVGQEPAPERKQDDMPQQRAEMLQGPVGLSIRLEGQDLTDREAELLAQWVQLQCDAGLIQCRKLWLYNNRIGDDGAVALAPLLRGSLLEVHLSHNVIGAVGAEALLHAVASPPLPRGTAAKGLWLRIEWNQIPEAALKEIIGKERQQRGLMCEIPVKRNAASRGHEASLQFTGAPLHVRLPWAHCQRQAPAAAAILREARAAWAPCPSQSVPQEAHPVPQQVQSPDLRVGERAEGQPSGAACAAAPSVSNSAGPLLLFPDTSAFLAMLGVQQLTRTQCPMTLARLQELAQSSRFGRALPPSEQTFVVLTDSVLKQLDGLKGNPALASAVRAFLGRGLDSCGPAGHDFLTVLGAHEGEGVVVAADAQVAGSSSPHMADKGQRVDAKIVEVALFFQAELQTAAAGNGTPGSHTAVATNTGSEGHPMSVVLLSADNAQLQLARTHGLPAARLQDMAALPGKLSQGAHLTASLLRNVLEPAATAGLGSRAGRSLQRQFDEAIACLRAVHSALITVLADAPAPQPLVEPGNILGDAEALSADAAAVGTGFVCHKPSTAPDIAGPSELAQAVAGKLAEWEAVVSSHQSASRVLKWSAASI